MGNLIDRAPPKPGDLIRLIKVNLADRSYHVNETLVVKDVVGVMVDCRPNDTINGRPRTYSFHFLKDDWEWV